jgi:hypothetical protein
MILLIDISRTNYRTVTAMTVTVMTVTAMTVTVCL